MGKQVSGKALLAKHVGRADRVLLVNPPVEETRYSWLRWNQPLDLLKLGTFLRSEVGCAVELFDFMKPDRDGRVLEQRLTGARQYSTVGDERYPMRRYGRPEKEFRDWLVGKQQLCHRNEALQVWITSLCSYWFDGVAQTCRLVKQTLQDVEVVLIGQYPRLMPRHAAENCAADLVVTKTFHLEDEPTSLDLYGDARSPFLALRLATGAAVSEVKAAVPKDVLDFAFFEDNVCRDEGGPLVEIFKQTEVLHKHLRYHIICGLSPRDLTPEIACTLANKKFAEIHFEQADAGDDLDLDAYRRARAHLVSAGLRIPNERVSGFVWIGRPGDRLEQIILRSFQVLECLGSLILKPFTPMPGGDEHRTHADYLSRIPHHEWSPHFFPFSELNGITREEYHDLYRMAAFLNEKVRSRSFDFLNGTWGAELLRNSLRKEAWKLEPSPLSIID